MGASRRKVDGVSSTGEGACKLDATRGGGSTATPIGGLEWGNTCGAVAFLMSGSSTVECIEPDIDLELHAKEMADSESEGSENVDESCVREREGGPRSDGRVGQLAGDIVDQEERQQVLMETVWKELQDDKGAEKYERMELGSTTERSRVGNEVERNTEVPWLVEAIDPKQQKRVEVGQRKRESYLTRKMERIQRPSRG